MVRGAYGQAGMMADADPVRPYFLKKCRFRMGHWTSQKDGEDLLPWGDLLSLDLSLDCFLQLDRLVAARSFRDQSSFLVVLDVEVIQR
jgi:hypothetical protein